MGIHYRKDNLKEVGKNPARSGEKEDTVLCLQKRGQQPNETGDKFSWGNIYWQRSGRIQEPKNLHQIREKEDTVLRLRNTDIRPTNRTRHTTSFHG
jgi:hypothetical protein